MFDRGVYIIGIIEFVKLDLHVFSLNDFFFDIAIRIIWSYKENNIPTMNFKFHSNRLKFSISSIFKTIIILTKYKFLKLGENNQSLTE